MKVKNIFVGLVATLCISSVTFTLTNNKETKPVFADRYYDNTSEISGLFAKVTDSTICDEE